jgi:hypothetical protein
MQQSEEERFSSYCTFLTRLLDYLRRVKYEQFKFDLYPERRFQKYYVMQQWKDMQQTGLKWVNRLDDERRRYLIAAISPGVMHHSSEELFSLYNPFLQHLTAYLFLVSYSKFKRDLYPEDRFVDQYVQKQWEGMQESWLQWIAGLDEERRHHLLHAAHVFTS